MSVNLVVGSVPACVDGDHNALDSEPLRRLTDKGGVFYSHRIEADFIGTRL